VDGAAETAACFLQTRLLSATSCLLRPGYCGKEERRRWRGRRGGTDAASGAARCPAPRTRCAEQLRRHRARYALGAALRCLPPRCGGGWRGATGGMVWADFCASAMGRTHVLVTALSPTACSIFFICGHDCLHPSNLCCRLRDGGWLVLSGFGATCHTCVTFPNACDVCYYLLLPSFQRSPLR